MGVDLLLGMDVVGLHPVKVRAVGHRMLLASQFGTGQLLVGNVPGDRCGAVNATAMRYARGSWEAPSHEVAHVRVASSPLLFEELEDLDVEPLSSCRACVRRSKDCPECSFRGGSLTLQELQSVEYMQQEMKLDEAEKVIRVAYPLRDEHRDQPNNFRQVRAVQGNIERRVRQQGLSEEYNAKISRMLEAGAARKLSVEEMKDWRGGVHYLPHFPVLNPESSSMALRIVMDSKFANKHSKKSLNDLVREVPKALNDIPDVQVRWRCFARSLSYDLSKAYHSLRTGPRELHLRRFIHRFSEEEDWQVYGMEVVAFGNMPAALALELAKELMAELGQDIDPMAANQLLRNSYVDDVGGGGAESDVDRMRGERGEDGTYSGTVPVILSQAGFRAKALVPSGTKVEEELTAMGGKFLGLHYDPEMDEIILKITPIIRMSRKKSKQRRAEAEEMNEEWLENLRTGKLTLTKRRVLTFVMSQYDPLGLGSPVMLTAKLLLRKLYSAGLACGWDEPLPASEQSSWQSFIDAAVALQAVSIPRAVVVSGSRAIWLVGFWDGSLDAYSCCIYARTRVEDDWGAVQGYHCQLLFTKTRVAPLEGSTIAKMELQGLVQLTRSLLKLVNALLEQVERCVVALH